MTMANLPETKVCLACGLNEEIHIYFFNVECIIITGCPRCGTSDITKDLNPGAMRQALEEGNAFGRLNPVEVYDLHTHFQSLINFLFNGRR